MKGWILKERSSIVTEIAYSLWQEDKMPEEMNWYNADHIIYFFERGDDSWMNKEMYKDYLNKYKKWIPIIEKYKV